MVKEIKQVKTVQNKDVVDEGSQTAGKEAGGEEAESL